METWSKDLFNLMERAAQEAEQFLWDFRDLCEFVAAEIDHAVTEALEPVVEMLLGLEAAADETTQPLVQSVHPLLWKHPACAGCRHYHGQVYGNQLLVCAMHPYGCEAEVCPDWQSTWESPN